MLEGAFVVGGGGFEWRTKQGWWMQKAELLIAIGWLGVVGCDPFMQLRQVPLPVSSSPLKTNHHRSFCSYYVGCIP